MKAFKTLILLVLVATFSLTSCEEEQEINEPLVSVEDAANDFEESLKRRRRRREGRGRRIKPDCVLDSIIDGKRPGDINHFVGIAGGRETNFGRDIVGTWTVNGEVVTPRRPTHILVNEHVTEAGPVEICFTAVSPICDEVTRCTVVDFEGLE
ncbi:hypothetical protein NBT05_09155 [Aquimarina sp. ERC-38]|uniref:hypothetical protein n=1 Tax=Aquimarina sp. ERC-38 TaxID=2949996 RepID=UPI002248035B|nr:hypothetical protein [Aquimarina sp. ERC-38]UZO79138.1 hypothetical protein NBT05_09155 [Aquimarina sp. ERC-38]